MFDPFQFPRSLPDPKRHPVILVSGLHDWFRSLSREYQKVFLLYLFNFDVDQQTPTDFLFRQALSTSRLAACYDMAGSMDRDRFVQMVTWRGLEDEPDPPSFVPPGPASVVPQVDGEVGYCYEVFFVPAARVVARQLGSNPWASAVASHLLAQPGVWSGSRFRISFGCNSLDTPGPAFAQAHVVESPYGLHVREIIPLLAGWMRLGAATGDKLALSSDGVKSTPPAVPTLFDDKPKANSLILRFGIFAKVKAGETLVWTPLATPAILIMLATYESVRLDSADFRLVVPTGSSNNGYAAITRAGETLSGDSWFGAQHLLMVPGSDQGAVMQPYDLPAVHSFNKELRAAMPGNGPPEFKFALVGDAGGTLIVTGSFSVEVSGQVALPAINVGKAAKASEVYRRFRASVPLTPPGVCSAPVRDVVADDADSEGTDED